MKKGFSLDYLALIVLIVTLLVIGSVISIAAKGTLTQSKNLAVEYAAAKADSVMQGMIQSFEKTAIFFGLMNAEKELGEHGGVSRSALSLPEDVYTPWAQSDAGTLYWAVARCNNTEGNPWSEIRKRPPFLFYHDYNWEIGKKTTSFIMADSSKHMQNFEDVIVGKYKFEALVQVFMLKKGTVTLKACQSDRCIDLGSISESKTIPVVLDNSIVQGFSLVPPPSIPSVVSPDDEPPSFIDPNLPPELFINPNEPPSLPYDDNLYILLNVTGSEDEIAVLRVVAVSIYNRNIVSDPNALLTKNINDYRTKLITGQAPVGVTLGNVEASLATAGKGFYNTLDKTQGFSKGIVWAPNKLSVAYSSDVTVAGWGAAEEDVKIRYWRIQDFAYWFSRNYEGWVEPRFFNQLQASFIDRSTVSKSNYCNPHDPGHHALANYDPIGCPQDTTPQYSGEDFRRALNIKMAEMATTINNELNAAGTGLRFEISIPSSVFIGCPINTLPAANQLEWCNSKNMEYYKYKQGQAQVSPRCTPYSFPGCAEYENRQSTCNTVITCSVYYYQRYVLKNVPINVTIFDDKYKIFDAASKTWAPYRFTFFVEIDRVDDNTCGSGDFYCSDRTTGAPITIVEPPVIVPQNLIALPIEETCTQTSGQICAPGVSCPSGNPGIGDCGAGQTCCVDSPPIMSSCILMNADPITGNCPAGTESCNTGCIPLLGQICCKPKTAPVGDLAVALNFAETYGLPTARNLDLTCTIDTGLGVQTTTVAATYETTTTASGVNSVNFKFLASDLQKLKDAGCTW